MKKLALLSNINLDMLKQFLRQDIELYIPDGYAQVLSQIYNKDSKIYKHKYDFVFCIIDGNDLFSKSQDSIDNAKNEIDMYFEAFYNLCINLKLSQVIISNIDIKMRNVLSVFETNIVREIEYYWWKKIIELKAMFKNVCVIDIKELVEIVGRNNAYSEKMWYLANIPYSLNFMKIISSKITYIVNSFFTQKIKCLAVDLDNTLWGGVIGEDGINGITLSQDKIGQLYFNVQKRIKEIKQKGVLLTILSKNNIDDVINVFENHPHMLLKKEDFIIIKANWESKALNIQKVAKELNIGIDSFAFLDDNPVEREEMRQVNPTVHIIDFPKDIFELENVLIKEFNSVFLRYNVLEEDLKKTEMYNSESERKKVMSQSVSVDDYIKKLEISICFSDMRESEIERVSQLTQKTNQFNLTTKRYTRDDIVRFSESRDYKIFTVSTSDKYGDNGLIAIVILKINGTKAKIDTFLMSCRVMGRRIENAIVSCLENWCLTNSIKRLECDYLKTEKNKPIENFFDSLDFILINKFDDGSKSYYKQLKKTYNNFPFQIKVETI